MIRGKTTRLNYLVVFVLQNNKESEEIIMNKSVYRPINKFECCGKTMVTVIIKGRAACVMPELEYNRMIEAERGFRKKNSLRKLA